MTTEEITLWLKLTGERLNSQDNRITQNPMFCVQEKRRLVGLDSGYSDHRCWHDGANHETIFDDDEGFKEAPEGDEWDEFGYVDRRSQRPPTRSVGLA